MKPISGMYGHYREIFKDRPLPLAFVDLDNFDRNIEYVAATQKNTGKTIRIHSKSLRCVELTKRILQKGGSAFKGIMTFTVGETAFLAEKGFDDFIVAYPSVQHSDMEILVDLVKKEKTVVIMVDCTDHLRVLSRAGGKAGVVFDVCLEVDVAYKPLHFRFLHLGVRRSPVRTVDDALQVAQESLTLPNVRINAVMGYEAHIAGPNDDVPGKWFANRLVRFIKNRSINELTPRRSAIVKMLSGRGIEIKTVNGGGSGSLVSTGNDPSVTEITAGSAFYAPGLFRHYKDVDFVPSAFFALQVVRKPAKNMVTCQGGGYAASGSPGSSKQPVPVYPEKMQLLPREGCGEVQTPLVLPESCPELNLGDPVFFQHAKAGELCERFNFIYLVKGKEIVDTVKTYRGEGRAFI